MNHKILQNKKILNTIKLQIPVFFESGVPDTINLSPGDVINGQALYGDFAKRIGISDALAYAKKEKMAFRVIEVTVTQQTETEFMKRVDRQYVEDGHADFLRFDKVKKPFKDEIDQIVKSFGESLYPHAPTNKTGAEWLLDHPSLGRRIFDEFPQVNTFVVFTRPAYSDKIVSVALLRSAGIISSAIMLFNENLPVEITAT